MTGNSTLLLVVSEAPIREALREQFELLGEFVVNEAGTVEAACQTLEASVHHAVIVDIDRLDPDDDSMFDVLRTHRPDSLILLCAGDADSRWLERFDTATTIAKPFKFETLLMHVRVELRKRNSRDQRVAFGPYVFSSVDRELTRAGTIHGRIRLTEKEAEIIDFLLTTRDRVASRDDLLDEVWGYNPDMTTHTLETHIYRLRRKMEDDPAAPRILLTEPGGYRIVS